MSREEIVKRYQYYQLACIKKESAAAAEMEGMIELLEDDSQFLEEEQQRVLRRQKRHQQIQPFLEGFGMMIGNGQLGDLLEAEYLQGKRLQDDIDQLLGHARIYQATDNLSKQRRIIAIGCLLKDAIDMNIGYFEVWETEIKNSSSSIQLTLPQGEDPAEEILPFIEQEITSFQKKPVILQKKISSV